MRKYENNGQITGSDTEDTAVKVKNKRLATWQRVTIIIVVVLYVIAIALASFVVFYRPSVEKKRVTYIETETDEEGNIVTKEVTYDRAEETSYNILVLGHDRAALLTDVFMLVNIDNKTHDITITQIPRDTWISDTDGFVFQTNKINAVFSTYLNYYMNIMGQSRDEAYQNALKAEAELLEKSLCMEIDYYLIMDLNGFVNIVDILGGVEIYVPQAMYYVDPYQDLYIDIPAGYQTLDGNHAEQFVRFRSGYATADLGRENAQKQFMAALFSKMKSSISLSNVSMISQLAGEIISNVTTNMSVADVIFFAQSALECDVSSMNMMTIPGNLASSYYVLNRRAVLELVNAHYNVFSNDISDSLFDPGRIFSSSYDAAISSTYYADSSYVWDGNNYNAGEINDDPIDIPRNY